MPAYILDRVKNWLFAALLAVLVVAFAAPQNLPVLAYKTALVTLAVVVGYLASRMLYIRLNAGIREGSERAHPEMTRQLVLARAIIVAGIVLGFCFGL
jgi:hypothetical protein